MGKRRLEKDWRGQYQSEDIDPPPQRSWLNSPIDIVAYFALPGSKDNFQKVTVKELFLAANQELARYRYAEPHDHEFTPFKTIDTGACTECHYSNRFRKDRGKHPVVLEEQPDLVERLAG